MRSLRHVLVGFCDGLAGVYLDPYLFSYQRRTYRRAWLVGAWLGERSAAAMLGAVVGLVSAYLTFCSLGLLASP